MFALGGVGVLAIIAIVLIFVLRGDSSGPSVATNAPASTPPTTPATPGTTTPTPPGPTTPSTTIPTTPNSTTPTVPGAAAYAHPGFDTPDAALDGYLQAIERRDADNLRRMMRDMIGPDWEQVEQFVEAEAKQKNKTSEEAWNEVCDVAKLQVAGGIVKRNPAVVQGDRATIAIEVRNPLIPTATVPAQKLVVRDANGRWRLSLEEQERRLATAMFRSLGVAGKSPAVVRGPSLPVGMKQYFAQTKELRGAWLVKEDDQPHMGWGWMTELLPYIGHEDLYRKIDFKQPFYRDPNRTLGNTVIEQFLNPADNRQTVQEYSLYRGMAVTHFVGVSGVEDKRQVVAAALPRSDARAGVFGYDRLAKPSEITDGTSNTIMMIGVEMPRPWIQGGGATIRGAREPYFGGVTGSQFGTRGQSGAITMMADGSVRLVPSSVDPKVFRDLCTIHGGERVEMGPFPAKEEFFGSPAVKPSPAKSPR
jgi:hypothetical protein